MKTTCSKCDNPLEPERLNKYRYCKKCQTTYSMAWNRIALKDPVEKRKQLARVKANNAIRRGKLQKQPCSKCGTEKAEKHHNDYNKPLDVTWLCRVCHKSMHESHRETIISMDEW